ncbi:uncharacterized protein Z520_02387 [Fonsecaea multimorphosa CBS 102226]|uniref:Uncharacterized protein n=1 Tax=Fonsecaea multimorphosa CBS 102226 TaxID=1442371 RepID=A0A0D2KZR5_9EURO|nr:uncharacterized protein Z520_02387 [Fonsecaea multimorphosa CBS 102226]KIY02249.1 hypothetical protein Z520_02387 [Fonsecaea multimorphosa CBS 102226]OAL28897.1 hypothetical protein AYO22_02333 [Fonsecaea multimorphosa]
MVFTDSEDDDLDAPRIKRKGTHCTETIADKVNKSLNERFEPRAATASEAEISDYITGHDDRKLQKRPRSEHAVATHDPSPYDSADEELDRLEQEWKEAGEEKAKSRTSRTKKSRGMTAKLVEAVDNDIAPRSRPRKATGTTGVGRKGPTKKRRRLREYGDSDSDEDLMEWTMPDYVRNRRAKFDERAKQLREGGLALPPTYDDVDFSDNERLKELRERPDFPVSTASREYQDIELRYSLGLIPAPIAQFLREYQVKGVSFMHELFVYQKGGILGDDMGLGKTVQVIAFLTVAYGKTGDERDQKRMRKMRRAKQWYPRTLIICPGTLMENWKDEFRRWGWWHVDLYHGGAAQRHDVLLQAQAGMLEVMITTYHTYRANKGEINMIQWDCVVADECHIIKERRSDTTKAMTEINALCRIGLTGTAIQNKYEELWTLLNWTNPGKLGPVSTWKKSVCEPLKLGQSHDASQYQLARARKTAKMLVQNLLPQFFLRRTKALIKDQLPKKSDRAVFCPLTATQAKAYENFLDSDIVQYIKTSSDPCTCGRQKKAGWCCQVKLDDGSTWQSWVFPAIANLRNLSNHLAILIPQGSDPADKQAKDLEMLQIAMPDKWREIYKTRDSILHTGNPEYCGKWRVLKKLLTFWHEQGGNKVLIFSHSVRLLRMLQNLFISTKFNVSYLDGSMQYEDRYAAVKEFNTDPTQFVFLISTRAGGVGLNITSANKVVIVDPNWNPSYDLQAQDRAYRIGQTRDVEVFRLISQGTLEEIVYARQIYKQQQANIGYNATSERRYFQGVQDRKDQKGEIFGLQNLFAYQNENQVLRDIVNKTNIAESKADVRVATLELEEQGLDIDGEEDGIKDEDNVAPRIAPRIKTDPDTEDAAISQLAAEIIGEEGRSSRSRSRTPFGPAKMGFKKHDPVQAILSSVGVSYTHENSEVIGSSKVEALLSKRAEEAASKNINWDTQEQQAKVFLDDAQSVRSDGHEDVYDFAHDDKYHEDRHDGILTPDGSNVRYKYRPPQAVRKRQFCSMARWAGFGDDVVSFALVVENWTQAQRRECLDRFYHYRRDVIRGLVKSESSGEGVKKEDVKKEEDDGEVKVKKEEFRMGDASAKAEHGTTKEEESKVKMGTLPKKNEHDTAEMVDIETASEDEDDEL